MLRDDERLHEEVEAAIAYFVQGYEERYKRYPNASMIASAAIDKMEEVLADRLMQRLFGSPQ